MEARLGLPAGSSVKQQPGQEAVSRENPKARKPQNMRPWNNEGLKHKETGPP